MDSVLWNAHRLLVVDKRGSVTSIQNKTFVDKTVEIRQESLEIFYFYFQG